MQCNCNLKLLLSLCCNSINMVQCCGLSGSKICRMGGYDHVETLVMLQFQYYSTSASWEHWSQRLNLHQMSTDWCTARRKLPNFPIAFLVNFPKHCRPSFIPPNKPRSIPIPLIVFEWHKIVFRQELPL